jgi:hypothetical protein
MKTVPKGFLGGSKKLFLGGFPKEPELRNSEYEMQKVGPNDPWSQNFSLLQFWIRLSRLKRENNQNKIYFLLATYGI